MKTKAELLGELILKYEQDRKKLDRMYMLADKYGITPDHQDIDVMMNGDLVPMKVAQIDYEYYSIYLVHRDVMFTMGEGFISLEYLETL